MSTFSSDAHLVLSIVFEETFDTTTGELRLGLTVSIIFFKQYLIIARLVLFISHVVLSHASRKPLSYTTSENSDALRIKASVGS